MSTEPKYTPGTHIARIYAEGGAVTEREFPELQAAMNWVTPYIMRGYKFDIFSADYLNSKRAVAKATGKEAKA